jgi:mRNA-degrading endonuclease YafQ of YafQ-DinJ toxin-antitoxin module
VACLSIRHYIDLIEAAQDWGISQSPVFAQSLADNMRIFPDLKEKLAKFVQVKLPNPIGPNARYGKHDSPMTGPLVGFYHCHLRDDAILIYNLVNRCVNLVIIVSHAEIEGKRAKLTGKKIKPYL